MTSQLITKVETLKTKLNTSGLYVLTLYHGKYYVGASTNLYNRLKSHIDKNGASKWAKAWGIKDFSYKAIPAEMKSLTKLENKLTRSVMKKYGLYNVRGGDLCEMPNSSILQSNGKIFSRKQSARFKS